jgi:hypothetical protein
MRSGCDLVFITFRSEDEMERCFRKKGKLARTEVWIDRDLSPQERKKQWEEREARRKGGMGSDREHAAYPLNQQQRSASPVVHQGHPTDRSRAANPPNRRGSRERTGSPNERHAASPSHRQERAGSPNVQALRQVRPPLIHPNGWQNWGPQSWGHPPIHQFGPWIPYPFSRWQH